MASIEEREREGFTSFRVQYRFQGKRISSCSFHSRAEAEGYAKDLGLEIVNYHRKEPICDSVESLLKRVDLLEMQVQLLFELVKKLE